MIITSKGDIVSKSRKSRIKVRKSNHRGADGSSRSTSPKKNKLVQNHIEMFSGKDRLNIQAQIYSYNNLVNDTQSVYSKSQIDKFLKKSVSPQGLDQMQLLNEFGKQNFM